MLENKLFYELYVWKGKLLISNAINIGIGKKTKRLEHVSIFRFYTH